MTLDVVVGFGSSGFGFHVLLNLVNSYLDISELIPEPLPERGFLIHCGDMQLVAFVDDFLNRTDDTRCSSTKHFYQLKLHQTSHDYFT